MRGEKPEDLKKKRRRRGGSVHGETTKERPDRRRRASGGSADSADPYDAADMKRPPSSQEQISKIQLLSDMPEYPKSWPPPQKQARGGHTKEFHPGGEKGKLHREIGVPVGEKIPAEKLAAAKRSDNPEIRRDAIRAATMKKWHHGG